jgi:CBS domain-containing protein
MAATRLTTRVALIPVNVQSADCDHRLFFCSSSVMAMMTVQQLLAQKAREVLSVRPQDTVYDAIKKMADENVGSLVVLEEGKLVGIITERHYARNVFLKGRSSPQTPVADIMERKVLCVRSSQSVEECMALMNAKRVRHLPVTDDGTLLGIVSIGDLVKSIISDREFVIEQLEHYFHG